VGFDPWQWRGILLVDARSLGARIRGRGFCQVNGIDAGSRLNFSSKGMMLKEMNTI